MSSTNAFQKYLLTLPSLDAISHVIDCLKNGEPHNQSWDLMEEFNGPDWKCAPEDLKALVRETIVKLGVKAIKQTDGGANNEH